MEHLWGSIEWVIAEIGKSVRKESNRGIFRVSVSASIVCGWGLSDIHISDFWLKASASIGTIVLGPAFAAFVSDIYKEKIKPRIFKDKHRY